MSDDTFVPRPGSWPVSGGTAELLADADRPGAFLLAVDGVAQSYVDLVDPTHLEFSYVRHLAAVLEPLLIDAPGVRGPDQPSEVLHVGGGAGTLARYLSVVAPGYRQTVVEVDAALAAGLHQRLGAAGSGAGMHVEVTDGREAVAERPDGSLAAVITDAFTGPSIPARLTTRQYLLDVRRALHPRAAHLMNVADGFPFTYGRQLVAGLLAAHPHALLIADPGVLHGRRFGNLVLVGGSDLPLPEITRRLAGDAVAPGRVIDGDDLVRWVGAAEPLDDDRPVASPTPPPGTFRIR